MNGTWKVTGGAAAALGMLGVLALGAAAGAVGAEWVLARLWWVLGTLAACAVLTAVIVRWLIGWADAHAVRVWAAAPVRIRAEPVATPAPPPAPAVVQPDRPALGPQHVTLNFYGPVGDQQAEVIRHALPLRSEQP